MTTNTTLSDLYATDPRKACRLALRRTVKLNASERMDAINALLGMHGVEAIRGEWQNGYWCDIVASYCNAGNSYDTTVIHVRGATRFDSDRFIVCSVGDWLETSGERYGVQ